eukprot:m.283646 g.283646  ORF g.283646 m.283646 type:complete len:69 (+) comp40671_c0_seq62:161-367(+)
MKIPVNCRKDCKLKGHSPVDGSTSAVLAANTTSDKSYNYSQTDRQVSKCLSKNIANQGFQKDIFLGSC